MRGADLVKQPTRRIVSPLHIRDGKRLAPFLQGEFDALCGLYTIINGLRLAALPMAPLGYSRSNALFIEGLSYLARRKLHMTAVTTGIDVKIWRDLAKHLCKTASNERVRFSLSGPPKLSGVSAQAAHATWIADSLAQAMPVLISLEKQDHYSVISGINATRLTLFDSWCYSRVSIASIFRQYENTILPPMMRIEAKSRGPNE